MKIGTKLILSFLVIALFIFVLVIMNWTIMEKVSRQSIVEQYSHELSKNIYLEEMVADRYIRRAASAQEFYRIHDNNSGLILRLQEMLSSEEEKAVPSSISNRHEGLRNAFEKNHEHYRNKINKLSRQKEIGRRIAEIRHEMKIIFTDPAYFLPFSENLDFYSPVSKKIENKNVLTLFRQLGYEEKEYIWQYKDKKHLDETVAVVAELETIVTIADISQNIKSEILSRSAEYKNYSINFIESVDENDLDSLSALSSRYSRELWFLREDNLSKKYVNNPLYGDKFKEFKVIKVGKKEIRASFEYLLFELGHHEKEVLYQDKGRKTEHYDEIIETYDSIAALMKELNLSHSGMDSISSILDSHKIELDNFMEMRARNEEAISEIREEKTVKITAIRKIVQEIQEGNSSGGIQGLDSLARGQGAKTKNQINILNTVNLIGGFFVLLVAICLGLYIPYSISKPLTNLSHTADEIGRGNLDAKIEIKSKDEIGMLARSFNRMTEDLHRSRDEIIAAKKYTDNIVQSMKDTLIVVSQDGIIKTVNHAASALMGYSEEELVGRPVSLVFADEKDFLFKGSQDFALIEKGVITNIEKTYLAKDGRKIPVLFSGSVMRRDDGTIQGIVCVALDITERKLAEEELSKLSSAVEQGADCVIITNKKTIIEYVNPAFEKLTGYTREEAMGKTPNLLKSGMHDEKFYKRLHKTIHSGVVFHDELINRKKNGELYYAETTIMPITDSHGNITHFVSTEKDITEYKKAVEIRIENECLILASKAKSEFLANMSHELRTPLNSIIGFSELLKQKMHGELNEKQARYVKNILTSSKFLLSLINDILDLSKVEAGKIELVIEKIYVPALINETMSLIKEKATKHDIVLKKELDLSLEFIEADQLRCKQILFNLLSNAVKFSKPEGGTIIVIRITYGNN